MSNLEALMWHVEKDPMLSSTFGSLTIFDRAPDPNRLRRRVEYLVSTFARMRRKVRPALGRLAPPAWVEDPEFDLDHHLRWIGLPSPARPENLCELAVHLIADPLDRTRPLWEFVVVEGLADGRAAMIQKLHHTITDGAGGIRLSERLVDLERDAPDPEPHQTETPPHREDGFWKVTQATLGHGLRRSLGVTRRSVEGALHALGDPAGLPRTVVETARTTVSVLRQFAVTDHARSPLWRERTLRRWFGTIQVPFDDAKRAAANLGGTLNDFFVTGAAEAAWRYHCQHGAVVSELRMAMPVSTRKDRSAGGNAFAPARVLVPTGPMPPAERFMEVSRRLAATKRERAISVAAGIAGLINLLPTSVLVRLVRDQASTVDFATSNVRAAPFHVYIAGARVEANFPLGPLACTAWNLTMMSYAGSLDMGLHVDSGAVSDPPLLRRFLEASYEDLIAAGTP